MPLSLLSPIAIASISTYAVERVNIGMMDGYVTISYQALDGYGGVVKSGIAPPVTWAAAKTAMASQAGTFDVKMEAVLALALGLTGAQVTIT